MVINDITLTYKYKTNICYILIYHIIKKILKKTVPAIYDTKKSENIILNNLDKSCKRNSFNDKLTIII